MVRTALDLLHDHRLVDVEAAAVELDLAEERHHVQGRERISDLLRIQRVRILDRALGKDADYVYGGSQWTPQVKYTPAFYLTVPKYVDAYKAKYPGLGDPDYHVAESTAACLAFQYAIEAAGSLDTEKVRDALAKLDKTTFFGILKFDSRGINVFKPMVVNQIQNGRLVTVYPPGLAEAKVKYPTPPWGQR